MDSFIRSKYESRRWAREGAPPADPSVLDTEGTSPAVSAPSQEQPPPQLRQSISSAPRAGVTSRQPQPHQLLSATIAGRQQQQPTRTIQTQTTPAPAAQSQAPAPSSAVADLFSLDFHSPAPSPATSSAQSATTASAAPQKNLTQDILSLYSTPSQSSAMNGFGAGMQPAFGGQQQQVAAPVSMMGNAGIGMWGVSSGWGATPTNAPQNNIWSAPGTTVQQQSLFSSNDVWGSTSTNGTAAGGADELFGSFASTTTPSVQKKEDAFDDIWGGFK